ncbi:MAG: hypothetical protein JRI95_12535 [Deltaproteobacteria bacterium]|nr:hypothetical protein [Deltaproteobacteria bacterium]
MALCRNVFFVCTVLAAGVLAIAYASKGLWAWGFVIAAFGLFWLYSQRLQWGWIASFGLTFFVAVAARGAFLGIPFAWLLISVVAALLAWDLDFFLHRLKKAGRVEKEYDLQWRHLKRLMIIASLGLILGSAHLAIKLNLHLGWVLLLGLISLFGLSRLIALLGRESD